jgi:TonB family protein
VQFTVEADGHITNAHVIKPVDPVLDAESVRVISAMPPWKPGVMNGKPTPCKFTLPFNFGDPMR